MDATCNTMDRNWGRVDTIPMSIQSRSLRLDEVESTVYGDSVDERLLPFVDIGIHFRFRVVTILFYLLVSLTIELHPIKDTAP
jgi:hypothetical protein